MVLEMNSLPQPPLQNQQSLLRLKIPIKEAPLQRSTTQSDASKSKQGSYFPLQPEQPSYPNQFSKRNFSTGGETNFNGKLTLHASKNLH